LESQHLGRDIDASSAAAGRAKAGNPMEAQVHFLRD
jgi:hypothetical protein